jgi:diguanylate cyclase (GGDEF)-like protein
VTTTTPARQLILGLWATLAVALALYVAVTLGLGGPELEDVFGVWVYIGLLVAAAGLCLARAFAVPGERLPWLALAAAPGLWAAGELLWELVLSNQEELSYPSTADALWLGSYVAATAGIVALVRARLRQAFTPSLLLDAVLAAVALAALGAALVFDPVREAGGGHAEVVATDLAYPLGDVVLLALVVSLLTLTGWRLGRGWWAFALALALQATSDGAYAYRSATGTLGDAVVLDALWPAAALLLAWAAWRPLPPASTAELERVRVFLVPAIFTFLALGLLVYDHFAGINDLAAGLAMLAIALAVGRLGLSFRDNLRMLRATRRLALTDPLTGLGNRRALLGDLDAAVTDGAASVLLLLDLDGFKRYNDAFGHPAGDELLARLGRKLSATVEGRGWAYRLGGDEFCVLFSETPPREAVAAAAAALEEHGDGFEVTCSHGAVELAAEVEDGAGALLLADRRLYAVKDVGPESAVRQSRDLLLKVISEREPGLHEHVTGVTSLALGVARRLGLPTEAREAVIQAAELHDIGKMAIPDAILNKPGPLDDDEWGFMRRHTIIGEEILSVAPALQPVAKLVRASHERWDGTGYPDGLEGEAIPLGARVVAVCDAFSAMTQDRPYHPGMAVDAALEEIRRSAGGHFDPQVVSAFADEVAAAGEPGARPQAPAGREPVAR